MLESLGKTPSNFLDLTATVFRPPHGMAGLARTSRYHASQWLTPSEQRAGALTERFGAASSGLPRAPG